VKLAHTTPANASFASLRYLVRIEGVDPETGKRKRVRAGQFTTRRSAEKAEAEALVNRNQGRLHSAKTTTIGQLLNEWLATKADEISANTCTDYAVVIRRHIKPALAPEDANGPKMRRWMHD
jgi:Arm domain-containing DNA-binding protein/integrase-like protein